MPIANYTTSVPVSRSLAQISGMLVEAGASSVGQHFEEGRVVGVEFAVRTEYGPMQYRMPVRVLGVLAALESDTEVPRKSANIVHAERVAWRIAHDWLRAQLALIQAGMATLPEVMFPYAMLGDGQTAFQTFQQRQLER